MRGWRKQWRLWRLGAVERYYFELKENNTYPFEDLGDGFYYILLRSDKFAFGIGTILVALVCYVSFSAAIGSFSFPLVMFLIVVGYGIFCLYGNTSHKELIISRYGGYLLRIKGNEKVLVEEPINNVYIKLQRKYDTNLAPHFYLILGGYRLDDIRMTGFCIEEGPFRILGHGVAERMGVNFFDVDNNSCYHKIYHYPNRSLISPPEEQLTKFLRLHQLTDRDVKVAKKKEHIEDENQVPEKIVSKILENYSAGETRRASFKVTPEKQKDKTLYALLASDEERRKLAPKTDSVVGQKEK